MAKARKQSVTPETPPLPQVGDKVTEVTYVITKVRSGVVQAYPSVSDAVVFRQLS
jgi:hypothetical protein